MHAIKTHKFHDENKMADYFSTVCQRHEKAEDPEIFRLLHFS